MEEINTIRNLINGLKGYISNTNKKDIRDLLDKIESSISKKTLGNCVRADMGADIATQSDAENALEDTILNTEQDCAAPTTIHTHVQEQMPSWANVVSNDDNITQSTLLITPIERMDSRKSLSILKLAVDPAESKVKITDITLSAGGKILLKAAYSDIKIIKATLNSKLPDTFKTEVLQKRNPFLILFNVPNTADAKEICKRQCAINHLSNDSITYKFSIPSKRKANIKSVVVETIPAVHRHLMSQTAWLDGFDKYPVDNFLPIKRCSNCQKFGHNAGKCYDDPRCGKCAGHHETKSCNNTSIRCANCISKKNMYDFHQSNSLHCNVYQQVREHIISLTNYG